MRRICVLSLLGLLLIVAAHAADPTPPWQRLLKGDDGKKATALQQRSEQREEADKYAEAISLREELIALRTKVQGAEHWETVSGRWTLTALKKVAALSKERRAGWRQAKQADAKSVSLEEKAHYAESLPLRQERLKWCREVLGEDHPDTATSYNNVADTLRYQGRHAEAGPLFRKALDIRRKTLGEEHPDTAESYNNVASSLDDQGRHAEAGPLYRKAVDIFRKVMGEDHAYTALCYNNVAFNLKVQGKYGEAEPLYRKALDMQRKSLGEDHPNTALSYNNLAGNLDAQGKQTEAEPLYRKALDIRRKVLGEDHPDTAMSYNNLSVNLQRQGRYAEAGPLVRKALDIRRKVLGEDHPDTAASYNNVAVNLGEQGGYAEAGPLVRKALDIRRKTLGEEHPDTAESYMNVADTLRYQGKYAEAGALLEKALNIYRKTLGEDHPRTRRSYISIGLNLNAQEKYKEAEPLFRRALDIDRKVLGEDHPETAASYTRVAVNLNGQEKYTQVGPLLEKALDICRKSLAEDHPHLAASYNNVAANMQLQGMYAESESLFQKALAINRKALGESHPETATSYKHVALNLFAQGKYAAALSSLEAAARSYEAARLNVATGLERAVYGAENSPYAALAAARSRSGRSSDAWAALEANLARGLLDEMALRSGAGLEPGELRRRNELSTRRAPLEARVLALVSRHQRTTAEDADLKRLLAQRQELEKSFAELAVVVSHREVAGLDQVQAALPAGSAFIAWVDTATKSGTVPEHWGCIVLPKGEPRWERLQGSAAGGKWTPEDSQLATQFREALARSVPADEIDALAKKLHAQRLAPLSKHLAGVKRLFVAPVNQMAGIPIEALTDQYTVSYVPSGTYLARLKDRPRSRNTRLLAIGDPLFPPSRSATPSTALPPGGLLIVQVVPGGNAAKARLQAGDVLVAYAGEDLTSFEQLGKLVAAKAGDKSVVVKVWREGQDKLAERELAPGRLGVALAREPAREAIAARRQNDQMLAQLSRGEDFAELPGTQVEIARLTGLFDANSVTTLTRADASEQRLDQLRKAGELAQFRYLHFATHGKANNVRAFDSALILTRPTKLLEPRAGEPYLEGRLTAAEVLEYWKLDAELVTLSACESGLGRQGGGDGLLGFAQSFLLAGSRSVCLTLWQVDDTATALLMDRFYRNLLGKREDGVKPMGKAAALREAKQWLRDVLASEALARLGAITNGIERGERPAREEMRAVPKPKDAAGNYKPYAHPCYWAAFILIGDPE